MLRRRITKAHEADAFLQKALKYQSDDCLIWPYGRSRPSSGHLMKPDSGYGQIMIDGKRFAVHRLVCTLIHGESIAPKIQATHRCGVPACVNPRHLRWASPKENIADRIIHGTAQRGRRTNKAKLWEEDVRSIRNQPERSIKDLAAELRVSVETVRAVRKRRSWAWLD